MTEVLNLPYYNNTNYPLAVKEQLSKLPYTDSDAGKLKYHQFIVKEFFTRNKNARGLLISHGMGSGKTRLAVSIADYYRRMDKHRQVVVLLSKSLEGNFRNTIKEYTNREDSYIDSNYKFVSLNASNMFKQVSNVDKTKEEIEYEKRLGDFMDDVQKDNSLDNSLLVIDEAHNLFNAITNGAKNATNLYDLIMASTNLKLVFLTGTPIINDPFELVPCYNMLRGYIVIDNSLAIGGNNPTLNKDTYTGVEGGKDPDFEISSDSDQDEDPKTTSADVDNNVDNNLDADVDADVDVNTNVDVDVNTNANANNNNKLSSNIKNEFAFEMEPENVNFTKKKIVVEDAESPKNVKQFNKRSKSNFNTHGSKKSKKPKDKTTLFSEVSDEFEEFFVDRDNKTIKNKDKFTNRIYGLSSYYGDLYVSASGDKQGFPKKLPTVIEKVPMSVYQFSRYILARNQELEETKHGYKSKDSRFSASKGGNSTYRVKSRQLSNYAIPDYALGPVRGAKAREKFINKITIEDLQNTDEFSPKMGRVFHNIGHHESSPGMIYSQFVSGEGLGIFARILEANGYKNSLEKNIDNGYDIKEKSSKNYAILSGDIDPEERSELIKTFNKPENADGSLIKLLLLSGAVAEGIDLKRIRHVHIMEPFWNYARINQVETRAIRYLSHTDLPVDQQNVQTYIYLSDYPKNYPKNKIKEPTTDVDLYTKSLDNMKIINNFMLAIAESSMDCSLHYPNLSEDVKKNIHCKMCSPTNDQLYHPLLNKDMTLPNACKPYSEKKVTAQEILDEITGEKFYYKKSTDNHLDIDIYMFNKKFNGFTPMPRNHPRYGSIYSMIIEKG